MIWTKEQILKEVATMMFNNERFQYAIHQEQLQFKEDCIFSFLSEEFCNTRAGGLFSTEPDKKGWRLFIGFYDISKKGVAISIPKKCEDNITRTERYFFNWKAIAKGIIEIRHYKSNQLSFF